MILTEFLDFYCQEHKINRSVLAKQIGIPVSTFYRLFDDTTMRSDHFAKIIRWLLAETVPQKLPEQLTDDERSVRQDASLEG
jgi:hypothetical protein